MAQQRLCVALVVLLSLAVLVDARPVRRLREAAAPAPALGAAVPGRYVVVFKSGLSAAAAQQQLHRSVAAALPASAAAADTAASAAAAAAAVPSFTVLSSLGSHAAASSSSSSSSSAAATSASPAAAAAGVQGVVIATSQPAVLAAIRAASSVAAVFPDLAVASQGLGCAQKQQLSAGVSSRYVSPSFSWPACLSSRTELRWIGERCGADMSQIAYTAVYAVYRGTDVVARVAGQECVLAPNSTSRASWVRQRFGGCGTPPVWATTLPTSVCPAPAAAANARTTGSVSGSSCVVASATATSAEPLTATINLGASVRCGSRPVRTLTYFGETCGPNGQYVHWTRATGPDGCTVQPSEVAVKLHSDIFGTCGLPPGKAAARQEVATDVCAASTPTPSPAPAAEQASPSPAPAAEQASPSPAPAAEQASPSPALAAEQASPSPAPAAEQASPSPAPAAEQASPSPAPAAEQASPSPAPAAEQAGDSPSPAPAAEQASPAPAADVAAALPRMALASGEEAPNGVKRIEAATAAGVVSTAGLPVAQQVVVGVMDSGVDATHPDINYAGGLSWTTTSAIPGDAAADVDNLGHGTHVAGIVGARNTGAGVVGVAPGVPVFSLKVLDGSGRGTLSTVMSAVKWVATVGVAQGVRVINLSLAAYMDPANPDYPATRDAVCGVFKEASDAGVVIVVAAGNYGNSLLGYFPASCPTVTAVTALDSDGIAAAAYSNFMPADAAAEERARVIAAPGSYIRSSVPFAVDGSGYKLMSGTSMAAPHVAGVAASCIMSGFCAPATSGTQRLATLQAAAAERYAQPAPYGFAGDAMSTAGGKFYGLLVWAGKF